MKRVTWSDAAVEEILPYYSTVDKVYTLMLRMNKKTNQMTNSGKKRICEIITKSVITMKPEAGEFYYLIEK
jgi:hypothetical protein